LKRNPRLSIRTSWAKICFKEFAKSRTWQRGKIQLPGAGCQRLLSSAVGKGYKESITGREWSFSA